MTINQATQIVLQAAAANANGSDKASEIIEAIALVRAYVKDQEEE